MQVDAADMNATVVLPDPTRCPDCRASVSGAACDSCGLALQGPSAARLWQVDSELLRLDAARGDLLAERTELLAVLHGHRSLTSHPAPTSRFAKQPAAADAPTAGPPAPSPGPIAAAAHSLPLGTANPQPAPLPRREWTPQRIQNLLLGLGGLLLAVAAVVFAAVTYDRLGAGGRAAVLVVLTLAAGAAAPAVLRRGLTATAETVGAVTLVLAALDAYGLRKLGLAGSSDPLSYAAASAALLAVAAGSYSSLVPLRVMRMAAVVLTQLPVVLLLMRYEASPATAGLVLAGLAAADLAVLATVTRWPADVRATLIVCAGAVTAAGLLISLAAVGDSKPERAAAAVLAHAFVLAASALLVRDRILRALLAGAPVPLIAVAAFAVVRDALPQDQHPLVPAAVGLLAALLAALLPRTWRAGPIGGSLLVSAVAVLSVGGQAAEGLLLPFGWLADPWSLPAGADAREAVGPGSDWQGTVDTMVVVAAAALTAGTAGLALDRVRQALVGAATLAAGAAVLLPLGLDLAYPLSLALLLLLAAGLGGAGAALVRRSPDAALVLSTAAVPVTLLAAAWATADREATLVVLPLTALLLAGLSLTPRLPETASGTTVALAGSLASAALAAAGAAELLAADQIGGLLLVAVAALLALAATPALPPARRLGAEAAAVSAALGALVLASGSVGWLSWVLAGLGLLAIATALRPGRRGTAVAGGLLLSASSWVRLADAGVEAPEPYVLPLAAVALILGHLRSSTVPGTRSWTAYGPGLSLLLLPSLLASFDDDTLQRPLLLGLAALGVLLAGAYFRLQAPLCLGGAVLAVDALQLLAPYAAALPRWMSLGAVGVLLVAIGATYEQRRRDVARLRSGYDALA